MIDNIGISIPMMPFISGQSSPNQISGLTSWYDAALPTTYQDGAVQFTAADKAYLNIADNAALSMGVGVDFTITGHLYIDAYQAANGDVLLTKAGSLTSTASSIEYSIYLDLTTHKLTAVVSDGTTVFTAVWGTAISTATWYFFSVQLNATAGTLTINVNQSASPITTSSVTYAQDSTNALKLGKHPSQETYLSGRLDSLQIWKRVLTATELTWLYNSGNGRRVSENDTAMKVSQVAGWEFGEEGGVRYDSIGSNHLSQEFTAIISPTLLNGGFETLGTNGGLVTNVQTSTRARTSNVATIVTAINHGLVNGNVVNIVGMTDTTFNGTSKTVTKVDDTTFTYASTGDDVLVGADTGGRITTTLFGNWTCNTVSTGTSTINVESAAPYAETYAVRMDIDATPNYATVYQGAVCVVGHKYKATYYAKVSATANIVAYFGYASVTQAATTSYVGYTAYGTAATGSTNFEIVFSGASKSAYIDNITLICTEIPSAAGIASSFATDGNLCASFSGSAGQKLSVASNASLVPGTSAFSVWGWYNTAKVIGSHYPMLKASGTTAGTHVGYWLGCVTTGNYHSFTVTQSGAYSTATSSTVMVPNQWYFLVGTWDGDKARLYVNGTLVATGSSAVVNVNDTTELLFGGYGYGVRYDAPGFIKRVLTTDEITSLFNVGKGVKAYASLPATILADAATYALSFWSLDEYSAGTGAVTRVDSGPGANNLTDTGTTASGQGVNYFEGSVSKWLDQSSTAANLIQTTQSTRLLYVTNAQNGKPVLRGDGVSKWLFTTTDIIGTGNITFFAVIKPRTVGGGAVGRIIDNGKFLISFKSGETTIRVMSDAVTAALSATNAITLNTGYVLIVTRTLANPAITNIYLNGSLSGTADQSSGTPTAMSAGNTKIGSNGASADWDGDIDEVGVYNSILSTLQIANLNAYLRAKWGV